jgi:hypothetical protein
LAFAKASCSRTRAVAAQPQLRQRHTYALNMVLGDITESPTLSKTGFPAAFGFGFF